MSQGLVAEWIDAPERWQQLRPSWDEAVLASARPCIFDTWDFLEVSWQVFARPAGDRLALVALHDGDRLAGFAPFRVSHARLHGLALRKLKWLPAWEADRVPLALPPGREREAVAAVLACLERERTRWDALELPEVAADGELIAGLREWAASRRDLLLREEEASPTAMVDLKPTWEAFSASLRPSTRRAIKYRTKQLSALAPYSAVVFDSPADVLQGLEAFLEIEGRSWKAGQLGVSKNAQNREFYATLLPRLAAQGRGRVALLRLGERHVAGILESRLGRTVYAAQTTMDASLASCSPGLVLFRLMMERAIAEGAAEYDLFAKFLENKRRWTQNLQPSVDVALLQWRTLRHRALFGPGRLRAAWRARFGPRPLAADPAAAGASPDGEAGESEG